MTQREQNCRADAESSASTLSLGPKSFPDFLIDKEQDAEPRFDVDSPQHHARLAIRCLELMQQLLKRNICNLPRYSMNDDVEDLAERRSKYISDALEYACNSWGQHLSRASGSSEVTDTIMELMTIFMRYHFLWWLEVLSIGASLRTAVYALRDAKAWLSQVNHDTKLRESIEDGERFILTFFDVIEVSASHIYESALLLSPTNSIIRKCYQEDSPRAWNASDDTWDACTRRIETPKSKCVVFSHKGDRIAACGGDKTSAFLFLIESATGVVLSKFSGHERAVLSVAFSSDDSLLVSGSEDCTVRLWDTTTGVLVKTLRLKGWVQSVGFSHDGSMIACHAGIWDGMLEGVVRKFDAKPMALAWSPSKAEIALGYTDGRIGILDLSNAYQEKTSTHTECIQSVAYTRDGAKIVSSSVDLERNTESKINIQGVDPSAALQEFGMRGVKSVCFSHEGTRLIIGNWNPTVIYDLASSTNVAEFKQSNGTTSISVSPDGQSIALADDAKLSIWQMNGPMRSSEATPRFSHAVSCVAISPDTSLIASAMNNIVKLWNFAIGTCTHIFEGQPGLIRCVAISPDSSLVASGSFDGAIRIWRVADHSLVCTLYSRGEPFKGVAFSPNGQHIASISSNGVARLWDIKEGTTVGKLEVTGFKEYYEIRFSDDDTCITIFDGERSTSWKMVDSPVSSADINQYSISFTPSDHSFDNHFLPLYKRDNSSQWIIDRNGVRVCWLPQDLRRRAFDCKGSKVAIGLEDSRVCWFDFGSSGLLSND